MRVALFVTCLVDLLRPRIGFAALELLEAAGCEVVVPAAQTCCGQPAWNSGDRAAAARLARKTIAEFEGFEHIVAPSGSCADHIKNEYPAILADDPQWCARARALAPRVHELTDFLVGVAGLERLPGRFAGRVIRIGQSLGKSFGSSSTVGHLHIQRVDRLVQVQQVFDLLG